MIENITNNMAAQALNVLWDFNSAISNNIANVSIDNYSPVKVQFDKMYQALGEYANSPTGKSASLDSSDMMFLDTQNTVKIETEMLNLTKNTVLYQAILGARNEYSNLLTVAIKGGK